MTPSGIEPATFRFVVQRLNHCATAVPKSMNVCGLNVLSFWFTSLLVDLKNGMILNSDNCNPVSEFPDVVSLPIAI